MYIGIVHSIDKIKTGKFALNIYLLTLDLWFFGQSTSKLLKRISLNGIIAMVSFVWWDQRTKANVIVCFSLFSVCRWIHYVIINMNLRTGDVIKINFCTKIYELRIYPTKRIETKWTLTFEIAISSTDEWHK